MSTVFDFSPLHDPLIDRAIRGPGRAPKARRAA